MAVYRGREVHILGRTTGEDITPSYDILDQWNERSSVKLPELHLTEEEIQKMKDQAIHHLHFAKIIADKDLQELKDSQDKRKIEERLAKEEQKSATPTTPTTPTTPAKVK